MITDRIYNPRLIVCARLEHCHVEKYIKHVRAVGMLMLLIDSYPRNICEISQHAIAKGIKIEIFDSPEFTNTESQ